MTGALVVVRHGTTGWSLDGRHTGLTDIPLTAAGEGEARAVGRALAGRRFAAVLCSPRTRAQETARLADLPVTLVSDDLREWDYGSYEGRRTVDIQAERERDGLPPWWMWHDGCPDGETAADVGVRVDRVLTGVGRHLPEGDVALVAHGHVLRVLTARWLGFAPAAGAAFAFDAGRVGLLGHEHDRPVVRLWNAAPGDPALRRPAHRG